MGRNIVLIILDTVRKDYFDEYADRLQRIADISFEQCRAASSWSVPSHASMFTGVLPHKHGLHSHNHDMSSLADTGTFLDALDEYHRMGVSANPFLKSTFNFDVIFDEFSDVSPTHRFPEGGSVNELDIESDKEGIGKYAEFVRRALGHDHTLKTLGNGAAAKVRALLRKAPFPTVFDGGARVISKQARQMVDGAPEPFFLFANFMDAHGPQHPVLWHDNDLHSVPSSWTGRNYDPWEINLSSDTEEYESAMSNYRQLYGASIDYLDRKIVQFVEQVQAATDRETTFLVTADHGENLGYQEEDGLVGHHTGMTESLLHVPLLVVNPPDGGDVDEGRYFSHLDLGGLVEDIASGELRDRTSDRIPAELVGGNPWVERATGDRDDYEFWTRMIRCAYEGSTKYLWDSLGTSQEYGVDPDRPCWQTRCAEDVSVPEWAEAFFEAEMSAYKDGSGRSDGMDVDEGVKDQLKKLGYY